MVTNPLSAARMIRGNSSLPVRSLGLMDDAAVAAGGAASEGWPDDDRLARDEEEEDVTRVAPTVLAVRRGY